MINMPNKLIIFEGIDGVGKTTISKLLQKELLKFNIESLIYEDYENKNSGFNLIKPFIKKQVSINSSLFFYISSGMHKSQIIQKLLKNKWVICDRYIYSTIAYHKIRNADLSLMSNLDDLPIILPNFYFLVKTKECLRIKRIKSRKNNDKQDFKPKKGKNLVAKMEQELEKFKPIIIDNSNVNTDNAIKKIINLVLHK